MKLCAATKLLIYMIKTVFYKPGFDMPIYSIELRLKITETGLG